MQDRHKTKKELVDELWAMRREVDVLKSSLTSFHPEGDVIKAIGNNVQAGIYIIQDDKTVFTNSYISLYSGYSPEELAKLSLFKETVHPEDQSHVRECGTRMLKGLELTPYEYRIIAKDGNVKWLIEESDIHPIRRKARRPWQYYGCDRPEAH